MKFNKKQFFSIIMLGALFFPLGVFFAHDTQSVYATTLWDTVRDSGIEDVGETAWGYTTGDPPDVRDYVVIVIKAFLGFLGIIFVILIIHAGYKWMTSAGSEDKIREAKSQIRAAIIGIIVILLSYGITEFVQEKVLNKI